MPANVEVVVLDIEGTVCPISFVKDVLFPYAIESLPKALATQWDSPTFASYKEAFPAEHRSSTSAFEAHVRDLTARDIKAPYLKSLQGYLWSSGYSSGELKCPLFPDVAPAISAWKEAGISVIIYSSGSVPAQKLLFGHTTDGDLQGNISGWFDTVNAGMKAEEESYTKIVKAMAKQGVKADVGNWLFLTDVVKEAEAAKAAGMQSFLVVREGNAPLTADDRRRHRVVRRGFEVLRL